MEYFPIFVDIRDRKVLVIGHYRVLEFKIEKLLEAGAKIVYLTNFFSSSVKRQFNSKNITILEEEFDEKHLDDSWLVVCGSDDAELKKRVTALTIKKKIFCNFVDEPDICSFISPTVISKGDITVAISTKGKSPALNRHLKNKISNLIGEEYVHFVELLGRVRQKVIENISDQKQRAELFDSIVQNSDILNLLRNKKHSEAENLVIEQINKKIREQNE